MIVTRLLMREPAERSARVPALHRGSRRGSSDRSEARRPSIATAFPSPCAVKCSSVPMPPLAITGMLTSATARSARSHSPCACLRGRPRSAGSRRRRAPAPRLRPFDDVAAGVLAAVVGIGLPAPGADLLRLDREHDALRAEPSRDLGDQLRPAHRGRVDATLSAPERRSGAHRRPSGCRRPP